MINRDSWGHLYRVVRGEILGLTRDTLLRKHLARMFSLIKNESWGIESRFLRVQPGSYGYGLVLGNRGNTIKLQENPKAFDLPRPTETFGAAGGVMAYRMVKTITIRGQSAAKA